MILKSTYDEEEKDKTYEQNTYINTREVNQRKLHDHFLSCRQSARHQIIKEISNERGLTINNYGNIILTSSNYIDVTDQVIEALKETYVNFELCV